jgi:hypothetical protein
MVLLALSSVGCGGASGTVMGKVTYQGKPVVCGSVMVIGSDKLPHYGEIKEDGSYAVAGVPAGPAKLTVTSLDPRTPPLARPDPARGTTTQRPTDTSWRPAVDPRKWFAIPDKYGDPEQSGLTLQVKGGSNPHDIALD